MKNKKIIIIVIIIVILLLGFLYYKNKRNTLVFSLIGSEKVITEYGAMYKDKGFVAQNGFGDDLSNYVNVVNNVDTMNPGVYKVIYYLEYENIKKAIERIVTVENIKISDLEVKLNGQEHLYILKDEDYVEEGANVYNKTDNSLFNGGDLEISDNLDLDNVGDYNVHYTFKYKGETVVVTRKVTVFDFAYKITPEEMTTGKVKITLDLNPVYNYSYAKLPNNYTVMSKNVEYEVSKNDEYVFTIVLSNKQMFKKTIYVDNIVGNYTCTGEITNKGTVLTVTPSSDEIDEYNWIINGKPIKGSNTYSEEKIISKADVRLTFSNSNSYTLNCSISDKLVYHFKYDENNTKPFMECGTYTEFDRIKLNAKLKEAVNQAGYGTRAGVVEAARFLVGALDYKVPYLGQKSVNSSLGVYDVVGLNIGQSGAWGCRISGWVQGMDCTHFVNWAFVQNGMRTSSYSSTYSNIKEAVTKAKVGDFFYKKCSSECKNDSGLSHIGMIIGIDSKNFYVAEATTGNINAIVVTKLAKNSIEKSKFDYVHYTKYNSEGNVTNMWLSE